jgi:NAD(P)-dependent dehydrogenase (short-subunit alcohol dehydrogenase family)
MSLPADPVWLITGCSTGFGRELARVVLDRGHRAVVTARDVEKVRDLVSGNDGRALALALDVDKPDQVHSVVTKAESSFGRIDVLVNNAGFGYLGAVEESDEAGVRAMFETNYFGLVRMTNAVLPGMRSRRSGHIVNLSSIGGLVAFPGVGHYNATKFAVEAISEALSAEVAPLGIKVLIVEPGPFRTNWAGPSIKESSSQIPDYASTAAATRARITSYSGSQPGDPVRAAEAIVEAVSSTNPPLRLLLGKMALKTARAKLDALRQEFDAWAKVTEGADYPEA